MYLVHVLAINAVESVAPRFLPFNFIVDVILSFLFSLFVASLLHFVENFSIATGRKISARYVKRSREGSAPDIPLPGQVISVPTKIQEDCSVS